jgi:hypothetical protein
MGRPIQRTGQPAIAGQVMLNQFPDPVRGRRVSRNTCQMGIYAELKVRGQVLVVADPSGGMYNAAGDFDRLLPVPEDAFPVLARVDPYRDVVISGTDLTALASEVAQLLKRADIGPEHRGLLRLRALALAGQDAPGAELRFVGD